MSCGYHVTTTDQWRSQSSAITRADGGWATCYYKVNFDLSFGYLGFIFASEVDEAIKSQISGIGSFILHDLTYTAMLLRFR